MGWANEHHKQQQAKQLRAIELATAQQAGIPPRKLTWTERNVFGVKDPAPGGQPVAPTSDAARIGQLEAQVAAMEARLGWAIERIQASMNTASADSKVP